MEDNTFAEAMTRMISECGKDVLLGNKVKAYISDYKGQFDMEAKDFLKLLAADCAKVINEAENVPERKRQLAERMEEKHHLSPKFSMPMLDLLGFLLRGDTSNTGNGEWGVGNGDRGLQSESIDKTLRLQTTTPLPIEAEKAAKAAVDKAAVDKAAKDEADEALEIRYAEAFSLWSKKKYKDAFPLLEAIAKEGYAPAELTLGHCYSDGNGVKKDYAKAAEWYRMAGSHGQVIAHTYINHLVKKGKI